MLIAFRGIEIGYVKFTERQTSLLRELADGIKQLNGLPKVNEVHKELSDIVHHLLDVVGLDDECYDEENFEDQEGESMLSLSVNRDHLPHQEPFPKTGMSNLFEYISKYSDRMDFSVSKVSCLKDVDGLNDALIKLHWFLVLLITEYFEVRGMEQSACYQIMSLLCVRKRVGKWMDAKSVVPVVNAII
jgi:hypothetical protein